MRFWPLLLLCLAILVLAGIQTLRLGICQEGSQNGRDQKQDFSDFKEFQAFKQKQANKPQVYSDQPKSADTPNTADQERSTEPKIAAGQDESSKPQEENESMVESSTSFPDSSVVLASLPSCEGVEGPQTDRDREMWQVLSLVLATLQASNVPYYLDCGSLLNLVRGCSLGTSDLDISVDLKWWSDVENQESLQYSLKAIGLTWKKVFGKPGHPVYEESWQNDKPGGAGQVVLDIFSSEKIAEGQRRTGIWIARGGTQTPYPCVVPIQKFVYYSWWGQGVILPFPFHPLLTHMYGDTYMESQTWTWYGSPFKSGYCSYDNKELLERYNMTRV